MPAALLSGPLVHLVLAIPPMMRWPSGAERTVVAMLEPVTKSYARWRHVRWSGRGKHRGAAVEGQTDFARPAEPSCALVRISLACLDSDAASPACSAGPALCTRHAWSEIRT